jgi:hypothetical protein
MQSERPVTRAIGGVMRAAATRRGSPITVVVVVVLALLASGCAAHRVPSAAANRHPMASPSPTATPITAAEREWIAGIAHLQKKIDKPFTARAMTMTRAKMTQLERAAGGCSPKLRRMGIPSSRLESVYAMAKKACRSYKKAARCFARAANVSGIDGGTFAGSPQERIQRRSLACGFAAQGNASNRFGDATAAAQYIEAQNQ